MKKILCLASSLFLTVAVLLSSPAGAQDVSPSSPGEQPLSLEVKKFWCMDSRYHIEFSVINKYTYDIRPTVAFKLFEGNTVFAIKRMILDVPAGSDGSDIRKVTLENPCRGDKAAVVGRVFDPRDINRVGIWLNQVP